MTGHRRWLSTVERAALNDPAVRQAIAQARYARDTYGIPDRPEIEITVVGDRNATSAAARTRMPWSNGGFTLQATGSSKREKNDTHDQNVGTALALARALRATAAGLEEAAWERVNELGRQRKAAEIRQLSRQTRRVPYTRRTTTEQVREKYGDEAAARHDAREIARLKAQS